MELIALIIGIFLRELLEIAKGFHEERKNRKRISRDLIMPLVRIADELVGRTYHHAKSDFQDQTNRTIDPAKIDDYNHLYDLYVWARFWAYTSRIRKAELSYRLSESDTGKNLLMFLDCLEASKVSIIPRAKQKLIGDGFADKFGWEGECSFYGFVAEIRNDEIFADALKPINYYYARAYMRKYAQALLTYTIIIHSMVESFDSDATLSSIRAAPTSKLGERARKDLYRRILPVYLKFDEETCTRYSGTKEPARTA